MPVCSACQNEVEPSGEACPHCGAALEEPTRYGPPASARETLPPSAARTVMPARLASNGARPGAVRTTLPPSGRSIAPVAFSATPRPAAAATPVPRTTPAPPTTPAPAAAAPKPAAAKGGEARLFVYASDGTVTEYPLGPSSVLGRSTGADVRVPDREASRKHSQIDRQGADYVLRDLGSSNGTFLNGKKLFGPAKLKDGDEVVIGTSRMEFRFSAAAPKREQAEITAGDEKKELAGIVARLDASKGFLPVDQVTDVNQLRRDYERLRIGHEFSRIVRLERDLGTLLQRILDLAFDLIPADSGVILLRDPGSGELVIQAMKQRKPGQGKVLVSETLLRQVTATKEGVLSSDAIGDERFASSHSIIALGVRSAMAVPLLSGDEVKGVMFLDSRERIAAFTTKDLEVLTAVAAQASVALENSDFARALEHEAAQKAQLSRFLSPALVEQAARGAIDIEKGGKLTELTILFSDIRGFTALSEKLPPQEVVSMLNEYFEVMVDVVFDHGGILDKFIGDAIMALFGAPVRRPDDATRAVQAAVAMQRKVAEFNEERIAAGKPPIRAGIGVHTGTVVVGNMGSSKALSYTAIGDGVNLASRLCGLAAADQVVISEECADKAGKDMFTLEPMPPAKVKNREQPVTIYKVLG
jgi:adenylate cyclase